MNGSRLFQGIKKLLYILCSAAVVILCLCVKEYRKASIAQKLKTIPEEELLYLDLFFRSCFNDFAYSLFGTKPMTVINYYEYSAKVQDVYDLLDIIFCTFHPDNLRIYRGWEFWQKHQHLFPSQNYAFVKVKNFVDNDYAAILFVNKKAFLKIVSKYITDFKNILGADVTPQLLLEKVLHGDDVFGDVLKHHQGLIGTLLGFGRDNAWLFHEREEISYYKGNPSPLLGESSYVFKKLPSQTSQEVLSAFNRRLQSFDDRSSLHFHPLLMRLPSFAADPATIETKQLKINYQQQYHQIVQRYKEGDFLEITLKQITSKPGLWES